MANSAQHSFSLIPEITYGTTPAVTPAFVFHPITATSLALAKGSIESQLIRPDRQVEDVRHGNRQVGGEIETELNYGNFDDLLAAVFCGDWASDELVPGTTRKSFSMLRHFTDLTGGGLVYPYQLYKGCEINTFGLTIAPEAIVKATFGVIGREEVFLAAAPAGATFVDPNAFKPFDSFTGFVKIGGVNVASVSEISLSLENGIEPRFVLFDDKTERPKIGKTRVTGNLTLYFANSDLLMAFNAEAEKNLEFQLTDDASQIYTFLLPRCKINGGQNDVSGEDDVTISVPFQALYTTDADDPDALKITRAAA